MLRSPSFVAIGHVTLDRFGGVVRPGGAALYAAVTAHRLGVAAGILTRHGADFPLDAIPPQIEVLSLPSERTTVFRHEAGGARRGLAVEQLAEPIGPDDVPADWRQAEVVLLGPVIDEVDPDLVTAFPEATLGAAAQGWLRRRRPDGMLAPGSWPDLHLVLSRIHALFVSEDDIRGRETETLERLQQVPVGVVTAAEQGALLFVNGERSPVAPYRVREVDPTGAGDVFAAAFMLHAHRSGDPWEAAAHAACAAALSVEGEGVSAIPDTARLERALGAYRQRLSHLP